MDFLRKRPVAIAITVVVVLVSTIAYFRAVNSWIYGNWQWDGVYTWVYTFNRDGTGTRGQPGNFETFIWSSDEFNVLYIDRGIGTPRGEARHEIWVYSIASNILTLESRDEAGRIHSFRRR